MAEELGMGATDTGVARLIKLYMADIKVICGSKAVHVASVCRKVLVLSK